MIPTLTITNANDPDNDILHYEFELYSDKILSNKIAFSTVSQQNLITSWTLSSALSDNTAYYWRARAYDGELISGWMPISMFFVNTSGVDTAVDIQASQDVSALAQAIQAVEVLDRDSPLNGIAVKIPPGALSNSCTITIGLIKNPPALPANIKAIGKIIEFGPAGITFSVSVPIMIRYTYADLDNAGIDDPTQLEAFTYNTFTLTWEKIPIDSIDNVNNLLICKVNHFSMYTAGITLTPSQTDDGEGGGGCFLSSIRY